MGPEGGAQAPRGGGGPRSTRPPSWADQVIFLSCGGRQVTRFGNSRVPADSFGVWGKERWLLHVAIMRRESSLSSRPQGSRRPSGEGPGGAVRASGEPGAGGGQCKARLSPGLAFPSCEVGRGPPATWPRREEQVCGADPRRRGSMCPPPGTAPSKPPLPSALSLATARGLSL